MCSLLAVSSWASMEQEEVLVGNDGVGGRVGGDGRDSHGDCNSDSLTRLTCQCGLFLTSALVLEQLQGRVAVT